MGCLCQSAHCSGGVAGNSVAEAAPLSHIADESSAGAAAEESAMDDLLTCLGIEEAKARL